MPGIEPIFSYVTFISLFIVILFVSRIIIEFIVFIDEKSASKTGQRQASASQKVIQRYYRRKGA